MGSRKTFWCELVWFGSYEREAEVRSANLERRVAEASFKLKGRDDDVEKFGKEANLASITEFLIISRQLLAAVTGLCFFEKPSVHVKVHQVEVKEIEQNE